jgi:hypothetical protein
MTRLRFLLVTAATALFAPLLCDTVRRRKLAFKWMCANGFYIVLSSESVWVEHRDCKGFRFTKQHGNVPDFLGLMDELRERAWMLTGEPTITFNPPSWV